MSIEFTIAKTTRRVCKDLLPDNFGAVYDDHSLSHAALLLDKVIDGKVVGDKANRQIGWAQCLIAESQEYSVDYFRGLNAACAALVTKTEDN